MGKIRRFLGIFVLLFAGLFAGNSYAVDGYTCEVKYTTCNAGYYLSDCGTTMRSGETITNPAVGNTCFACPAGFDCAGGNKCPETACIKITLNNSANNNAMFTVKNSDGSLAKADAVYKNISDSTDRTIYSDSKCSKAVTINKPTKANSTFNGFYTASSGGSVAIASATNMSQYYSTYKPTANSTLYARYTCSTGYALKGQTCEAKCIGVELRDVYKGTTVSVYRKYNSGDLYTDSTCSQLYYLTLPAQANTTFMGYYDSSLIDGFACIDTDGVWSLDYCNSTTATTLYAKYGCDPGWQANGETVWDKKCAKDCFAITLDNKARGGKTNNLTVYKKNGSATLYGDSACTSMPLLRAPSKDNATFLGYYTESGMSCMSGTTWNSSGDDCNTGDDMTLYAHYNCNSGYNIYGTDIVGQCVNNELVCVPVILDKATNSQTTTADQTIYKKVGENTLYSDSTCTTTLTSITSATKTHASYQGYYDAKTGGNKCITSGSATWNSACGDPIAGARIYAQYLCSTGWRAPDNSSANTPGVCEKNCFKVTLNSEKNGGTGGKAYYYKRLNDDRLFATSTACASTANSGTTLTVPTKDHASFDGYYNTDAASGGIAYLTKDGKWLPGWNPADDSTTLYAQYGCYTGWGNGNKISGACSQECIKVNLDNTANGGGPSGSVVYRHYASDILYSDATCTTVLTNGAPQPYKPNGVFTGYYTEYNANCILSNGTWQLGSSCDPYEETTLYARYQCNAGYDVNGEYTADACSDRATGCIKIELDNTSNGGTGGSTVVYKKTGSSTLYSNPGCDVPFSLAKPTKANALFTGYVNPDVGSTCISKEGRWNTENNPLCDTVTTQDTKFFAHYSCDQGWRGGTDRDIDISGACIQNCFTVWLDPDSSSMAVNNGTPVYKKTGDTTIYAEKCLVPTSVTPPTKANATYTGHYAGEETSLLGDVQYITPNWEWKSGWEPTNDSTHAYSRQECNTGYSMNRLTGVCVKNCIKVNLNSTQNGGTSGAAAVYKFYNDATLYSNNTCTTAITTSTFQKPSKANAAYVGYNTESGTQCIDATGAWRTSAACNPSAEITLFARYQCNVNWREAGEYPTGACVSTISATASTVSKTYNGTALTCNGVAVTAPTSGFDVKYCTVFGCVPNSATVPSVTNVSDSKVVYYMVTADNYVTKMGSFECNIDQANNSVALNPTSGTIAYTAANKTTTTTVTTNTSGGAITATSNNSNVTVSVGADNKTITMTSNGKVASNVTITVTSAATENYKSASTTFTLNATCGGGLYNKSGTCTACAVGSYSTGNGNTQCTACQNGTTTNGTGQTSCNATCSNAANVGVWKTVTWASGTNTVTDLCTIDGDSANACIAGVTGTGAKTATGAVVNNACVYSGTCNAGYVIPSVSGKTVTCTACPTAYPSSTDGNIYTSDAYCYVKLTAGQQVAAAGVGATACDKGKYCTSTANIFKGTAGGTTTYTGTACQTGSYQDETGKTVCKPCEGGKTNTGTGNTAACTTACTAIANLSTWATTAWSNGTVSNLCTVDKCVAGSYKSANTCPVCATDMYSTVGASSCSACATDKGYHNSGTTAADHADAASCKATCQAGNAVQTANAACAVVTSGYQTGTHTVAYGSKTPTAADTVSPTAGTWYSCLDNYSASGTAATDHDQRSDCKITCTAGTKIASANATSCTTPSGNWYTTATHSVAAGSTSGTNCVSDYTITGTTVADHNEAADCKLTCSAGYYTTTAGGACTACPAGQYCNGGTTSQTAALAVTGDVSAGYYSNGGGTSATPTAAGNGCITGKSCGTVSSGYYNNGGGTSATPTAAGNGCLTGKSCGTVSGGYYNNGGGTSATPTAAGNGCVTGKSCGKVTAGYYSNGGGTSATPTAAGNGCITGKSCGACGDGAYSLAGASSCSNCSALNAAYTNSDNGRNAAGTCYLTTESTKYVATPNAAQTTCAAGGYCPGGVKVYYGSTGGRTACPAGKYNASTGSSVASACVACVTGSYASGTGNTQCTACTSGKTTSAAGQSSCNANCTNAANVTAWAGATWKTDNSAVTNLCTIAANGCAAAVKGTGANTATYSVVDNACVYSGSCNKGYATPTAAGTTVSCTQCSAGYYQGTDGSTAAACTPASKGYNVPAAGASSQTACGKGKYQDTTGQSSCKSCPALTANYAYTDTTALQAVTACTETRAATNISDLCSAGTLTKTAKDASTWNAATGDDTFEAKAGSYVNGSSDNRTCTTCAKNSYCTGAKAAPVACSTLGGGLYTLTKNTGSSAATQCYASVAGGKYIAKNTDSAVSTCANWTWKAAHEVNYAANGGTSTCDGKCPDLTSGWTKGTGTGWSAVTNCYQTKGVSSYCTQGMLKQNATSTTAWGTATESTAVKAKAGSYVSGSLANGNLSCTQCSAGTYQGTAGSTAISCTDASKGYYVSDPGASEQTACPAGTYTSSTKQSACTDAVAGTYTTGCGGSNNTACTGTSVCATDTWSDAKASACTACTTAKGYHNSGTSASNHAGLASCVVSCGGGSYVATAGAGCANVGAGYWGAGGTADEATGTIGRTQCAAGLTTIGYGAGANEAADCGRILNVGSDKIYLRSVKKTTPSLNVKVGGTTYYGNMTPGALDGYLIIKDGNVTYRVHDDSK